MAILKTAGSLIKNIIVTELIKELYKLPWRRYTVKSVHFIQNRIKKFY